MNTINITNARKNLFQLVSDVNKGFNPVNIINNKGGNAILLSENNWRDIEETIYLNSIPGFVDSVEKARKEDKNQASIYIKGEEWQNTKYIFLKQAEKDKKLLKQAGLETKTKETLLKYREVLLESDDRRLDPYAKGARCTFPDFTCTSDCKFPEEKRLTRKI